MANRTFRPLDGSLTQGVICLTGEFTYGQNGAATDIDCDGFTVGDFNSPFQEITLDDKYAKFIGLHATFGIAGAMTLQSGFNTDLPMTAVAHEENVSSTRIIKFVPLKIKDGSVQTVSVSDPELYDLADDFPRGTKVSLLIWVKNSSV